MSSLRFLLDGNLVEIDKVDPTRTVLQYLREDLLRVGSKEGCAEGDCGACTVVLAELVDEGLRYRAVNACIQFLPTLDGKALFTVESLQSGNGDLHPVQQSMVDYHGSQCGFCTPGFIMSMFALYQTGESPDRAQIDDALSGNLCRCTGYRPIIEACEHMFEYQAPQSDDQPLIAKLQELQRDSCLQLQFDQRSYHAPATVEELADLYQHYPEAHILAGGTDVGLWVTKQLRELPQVIYLAGVEALKQIRTDAAGISIGAAVSLTDAFDQIVNQYPELDEMFRRFASVPVRNAGTLAGNVANGSPIGDSMPALIAIGAEIVLRKGQDKRRLPLQALYLDYMKNAMQPGEFIESIEIPTRDPALLLRCYKICKRYDQDISAVCAAFALKLDGDQVSELKISFGGMAAIPKRAELTEKSLLGQSWDESTVETARQQLAQDFTPMTDMRASADYRRRVSANLLYRFYLETRTASPLANQSINVFEVSA